jgi:hypothetical protein
VEREGVGVAGADRGLSGWPWQPERTTAAQTSAHAHERLRTSRSSLRAHELPDTAPFSSVDRLRVSGGDA